MSYGSEKSIDGMLTLFINWWIQDAKSVMFPLAFITWVEILTLDTNPLGSALLHSQICIPWCPSQNEMWHYYLSISVKGIVARTSWNGGKPTGMTFAAMDWARLSLIKFLLGWRRITVLSFTLQSIPPPFGIKMEFNFNICHESLTTADKKIQAF